MTETPPTLTDFLLARIAEDEAAAREWYGLGTVEDRRDDFWVAECEAKRRIVGMCTPSGEDEDGAPFYVGGYGEAYVEVLGYLALPYAEHPDYRDEWKP